MSKEFPDEFSPVPTPLTGSERVLVEKGTATIAVRTASFRISYRAS